MMTTWKAIGKSVIGLSHQLTKTGCDDALAHAIVTDNAGEEILICFASDGAGSASQAAAGAQLAVTTAVTFITDFLQQGKSTAEKDLYLLAEQVYDTLALAATRQNEPLEEYSCTLLGCILAADYTCFVQVGDGAIVKNDGSDYYTHIWWPHNGEYQNTTAFITDNNNFRYLKVLVLQEQVTEVALFTDGLQMLTLNYDAGSVHQPFFNDMFKWLRMASLPEHITILNQKLEAYLGSPVINKQTDDDKTLFLATRLKGNEHV